MNNTDYQNAAIEALGKVIFDLRTELYFSKLEVDRLKAEITTLESEIAAAAKKGDTAE